MFNKYYKKVFIVCLFVFSLFSCSKNKNELNIYSNIDSEDIKTITDMFTKQTGIKCNFISSTSSDIFNRIISEKKSPKADVIYGGIPAFYNKLVSEDILESYVSPMSSLIMDEAKYPDNKYYGYCEMALGIGYNKKIFDEKGISVPKTWDDLLNSIFKGEIVLTNPLTSSTAYLFLRNQIQRLGWAKGWTYLKSLSKLIGQLPDSGYAPAKLIGLGEYEIGILFIHSLYKLKAQGFEVDAVLPPCSIVENDCVGIIKDSKNLEAAQKFVDFVLTKEVQDITAKTAYVLPVNRESRKGFSLYSFDNSKLIYSDEDVSKYKKDEIINYWKNNVE